MQMATSRHHRLLLVCVALLTTVTPTLAADKPTFRLQVDPYSGFAPQGTLGFAIGGCNCSAYRNWYEVDVDVRINGIFWRTLPRSSGDFECVCLPDGADGSDGKASFLEVLDRGTGEAIANTTMYTNTSSFFWLELVNLQAYAHPSLPSVLLNFTTPNHPKGADWATTPQQLTNGRAANVTVPRQPAGVSLKLGELVRVVAYWAVAGDYPHLALPPAAPDDGHPPTQPDLSLGPYYTAAGPPSAGIGTRLTIHGVFLPSTVHVAELAASGKGTALTKAGTSNAAGSAVTVQVPSWLNTTGFKPGESIIVLVGLRYEGDDGKQHSVQMGADYCVFTYIDVPPPPSPPPSFPAVVLVVAGVAAVLAGGTGLFLYRRRRRRYSEIGSK